MEAGGTTSQLSVHTGQEALRVVKLGEVGSRWLRIALKCDQVLYFLG